MSNEVKFDPTATPECDNKTVPALGPAGEVQVVWLSDAKVLERRARVAEEQLRLALLIIDEYYRTTRNSGGDLRCEVIRNKIKEIEKVNK